MSTNQERGDKALSNLERELKSRERRNKARPLGVIAASAAAILLIGGGIVFFATRDSDESVTAQDETSTSAETTTPEATYEPLAMKRATPLPATVTCDYRSSGEAANDATVPAKDNISTEGTVTVKLETNKGPIPMELDRSVAPCTVNAMEHLAKENYFDDTVCHRITTEGIYVLQCGDPTGTGSGGPGFEFDNEYPTDEADGSQEPVSYPRGSIAMANAGEGTNGSQFFLNYGDSPLPPAYTYFGQITEEGLSTLDSIAEAGADGGAADGQPAEQVVIEKTSVA